MKPSFALTAVLALRAFAQSSSVLFDQAVAQLDAGKPAEAFALFFQIARREPNELGTRAYLVKAAVAMDDTAAACTNLDLLRRLATSDSGLHAQLAEWCAPGRSVELGVDQLRYALKLEQLAPQKARLYYLRGSLAARQGAEELAKDDLGRAMALDPGTPLYVVALATLQGTARPKIDPALLRDGLQRFPLSTDLLALSALRALDSGDNSEARILAARLMTAAPNSAVSHVVTGRIELSELNLESARAAFERSLALRKLGQDAQAIPELQQASRLNPVQAAYHFEYGRALFENSRFVEARRELEQRGRRHHALRQPAESIPLRLASRRGQFIGAAPQMSSGSPKRLSTPVSDLSWRGPGWRGKVEGLFVPQCGRVAQLAEQLTLNQ